MAGTGAGNMQGEAGASIVPENKEMLKQQQQEPGITCVCQSPRSHLKELLITQTEQQNKIVLDDNPKYKINIHESILI